jgi:hypothetical protein
MPTESPKSTGPLLVCVAIEAYLIAASSRVYMEVELTEGRVCEKSSNNDTYVSIRKHTSSSVSIGQLTSAYASIRQLTSAHANRGQRAVIGKK